MIEIFLPMGHLGRSKINLWNKVSSLVLPTYTHQSKSFAVYTHYLPCCNNVCKKSSNFTRLPYIFHNEGCDFMVNRRFCFWITQVYQ